MSKARARGAHAESGMVPRKRIGSTTRHDKGVQKFYSQIYTAMLKWLPLNPHMRAYIFAAGAATPLVTRLGKKAPPPAFPTVDDLKNAPW